VGKLIPPHGCATILHAAALLIAHPIHFTLIGSVQDGPTVRRLVAGLGLSNVTLIDWVDYERLAGWYADSDICLGIFGDSDQANRVVPNKVYQALAVGRAVITRDSSAIREMFEVGEELWACRAGDPDDFSRQILKFASDGPMRHRIADAGHIAFCRSFDIGATARRIASRLESLVGDRAKAARPSLATRRGPLAVEGKPE